MLKKPSITRRRFFERAGRAAVAVAAPAIVSSAAAGWGGRAAPGDRITAGMIGVGRKTYNVNLGRQLLKMPDVQVVGVCDVGRWRPEQGKQLVQSRYGADKRSGSYCG